MTKKAKARKKIKIAFAGTSTLTKKQAIDSARFLLSELTSTFDVRLVVTVKEDLLGKAIRHVAKKLGLKIKTHTASRYTDQSNALELATAGLMWDAKRILIVTDGNNSGCALYAAQMALRLQRKVKVFELEEVT